MTNHGASKSRFSSFAFRHSFVFLHSGFVISGNASEGAVEFETVAAVGEGDFVVDPSGLGGGDEGLEEGAVGGFVAAADVFGEGGDVHGADPLAGGAVHFHVL